MCYALILISYRGEKGAPQMVQVDSEAQLATKRDEAQARPEATKVDVYIHSPHASTERVEEWRSRATILPKTDETKSQREEQAK